MGSNLDWSGPDEGREVPSVPPPPDDDRSAGLPGDRGHDAPDEPVVLPIEDHLDLHPFHPREIPEIVGSYLEEAVARGFREVRLIHGRGIGFQRDRVRQVLSTHPLVDAFCDAPVERGHWGATIVRLRART